MADHSNRIPSRHHIFISGERASLLRGNTQDIEIVSRHFFAPDLLDLVRVTKLELPDAVGCEPGEHVITIAKVEIAWIGRRRVWMLFAFADVELDQLLRVRHRPWPQEE